MYRAVIFISIFVLASYGWGLQSTPSDIVLLENDDDGALIYRPSEGVVFLTSFQLFRPMKLILQLPNQKQQLFFGVYDRGNRTGSSLSRATFRSLDQVKFDVIEGSELDHSLFMRIQSETINEGILRALESGDTFSIALREGEDGPWIVGSYKPRPIGEESYRRLAENSPELFCGSTQVFNHIDKNNPVAPLKVKGEQEDVLIQDVIAGLAIDCDQVLASVKAKEENQDSLWSAPEGHVFVWLADGFTRDGFKKMMSMRPKAVKYCLACEGDQCLMKQWPEEREDEFNLCKRLFATPRKPRPGLLEDNSKDITIKSFDAAFDFKISKNGRGELLRISHLEGEYSMKEATKVISRALYRVKYEPLVLEGQTVEITNLSSAVRQRNSLKNM